MGESLVQVPGGGETQQPDYMKSVDLTCPQCQYKGALDVLENHINTLAVILKCPECDRVCAGMQEAPDARTQDGKVICNIVVNQNQNSNPSDVGNATKPQKSTTITSKKLKVIEDKETLYNEPILSYEDNTGKRSQTEGDIRSKISSNKGYIMAESKQKPKEKYNGARVEHQHEDVCPQEVGGSICPFTPKKEEGQLVEQQIIQSTAKAFANMLKASDVTKADAEKLAKPHPTIMSEKSKEEILKTASMYPEVSIQPGSGPDLCRWCPKIRRAISMYACGQYCIDGRRVPQVKNEVFSDYIMNGGDPTGFVECGYKKWMETQMDKFYPGWVEDHIKKSGGDIAGGDVIGGRKMNLDDSVRRHLPRYPEEIPVERVMDVEERHHFSKAKTISSKRIIQAQNQVDYTIPPPIAVEEDTSKEDVIKSSISGMPEVVQQDMSMPVEQNNILDKDIVAKENKYGVWEASVEGVDLVGQGDSSNKAVKSLLEQLNIDYNFRPVSKQEVIKYKANQPIDNQPDVV